MRPGNQKSLELKLVNPKGEENQLLTALHEYMVKNNGRRT